MLPAIAGLCSLAAVMGIGRFLYTTLLPDMMLAHGWDESVAGYMAAWNYAGYLAGVLSMRGQKPGLRRYVNFILYLALSLATTAGMGLVATVPLWTAMRVVSGFASGACFVLCSSIVLDALAAIKKPQLAGFMYSGVGCGIALGGLTAPLFLARLGVDGAWIAAAALCVPLAVFSLAVLRPGKSSAQNAPSAAAPQASRGSRRAYNALLAAYFLEGFGYIIGTTFLVAQVRATTGSAALAGASWIFTGIAAAVSTPVWRLAVRSGYLRVLVTALLVQAVGALLPAVSSGMVGNLAGGMLLGGTFMGIVVLSLQYGVSLSGKSSAYTVAVLTGIYGVGQIFGPFVAGLTATEGQGFGTAFVLSSASLFLAAAILIFFARPVENPDGEPQPQPTQ